MALVAVGSAKGGAGVSTLCLALAAAWQLPDGSRPVLVEADPRGGDVQLNFELGAEPGLVGLAAAVRRTDLESRVLRTYAHRMPEGATVVTAPIGADRAVASLELLEPLWQEAEFDDVTVLADLGRLLPTHVGAGLNHGQVLEAADLVLLVSHGSTAALTRTRDAVTRLPAGRPVAVAVVGATGYGQADIAAALGVPCVALLPHDERSAASLRGDREPRRRRGEPAYPFLGGAKDLGDQLTALLPQATLPAPVEQVAVRARRAPLVDVIRRTDT